MIVSATLLQEVGAAASTGGPTIRWTGATASDLLIKLIRFYHGAC